MSALAHKRTFRSANVSADFSITRRRKTSGRDRSLVGSCGVSRLTALADQAGSSASVPGYFTIARRDCGNLTGLACDEPSNKALNVRIGSKADIETTPRVVRFTSDGGRHLRPGLVNGQKRKTGTD
jgi:hypothetical protein